MSVPSILNVSHFSTGGWSTSSSAAPRKESLPLLLPILVTNDPTVPWGTASLMWSSLQWSDVVDREAHHWVSDIHNPVSETPEWGVSGSTVCCRNGDDGLALGTDSACIVICRSTANENWRGNQSDQQMKVQLSNAKGQRKCSRPHCEFKLGVPTGLSCFPSPIKEREIILFF